MFYYGHYCRMGFMSKHIPEGIKAVLLDHDDTLVDTINTKWAQHKYVAKRYYGKIVSDAEIIKHWGKTLQELVGLLYGTDDVVQALAHNTKHAHEFPKTIFEESIPTLRHLKASGMVLGIITATSRFSFESDLDLHSIPRELLDYTQTSDDTAYHKPDKRVFDPAIAFLATRNILPAETLYVGDGLHDMRAATEAGFYFLGVETGLVNAQQFLEANASSIPSIAHLVQ